MPYYLVTHTSLVEAVNDDVAAEKAFRAIKLAKIAKFTVKFDDDHVAQVTTSIAPDTPSREVIEIAAPVEGKSASAPLPAAAAPVPVTPPSAGQATVGQAPAASHARLTAVSIFAIGVFTGWVLRYWPFLT